MDEFFRRGASRISKITGSYWAFFIAVLTIIIWSLSGPMFGYSDTWQLVINTLTTVVTFLMVFLIQNTQNRDTKAMHLKLDELLRASKPAKNDLINVENLSDKDLDELQEMYTKIQEKIVLKKAKLEDKKTKEAKQ